MKGRQLSPSGKPPSSGFSPLRQILFVVPWIATIVGNKGVGPCLQDTDQIRFPPDRS